MPVSRKDPPLHRQKATRLSRREAGVSCCGGRRGRRALLMAKVGQLQELLEQLNSGTCAP